MKRIVQLTTILLVILLVSGCNKTYIKEISYKEYQKLIDNKETFILEIMKTDCSACINFKPKITQVANDYEIEVKYINTDNLTEDELNNLYQDTGISGTPTVIFYNNGEENTKSSRINGSVSTDKIISKFKASGFIK